MPGGPLGKYSQIVAAVVATGVIAAAIASRFLGLEHDTFIDNLALIAAGAIFGAAASTAVSGAALNGVEKEARAAHQRLDFLAAPPASINIHTAVDAEGRPIPAHPAVPPPEVPQG